MWETSPAHAAGVVGAVVALSAWFMGSRLVRLLAFLRLTFARRLVDRCRGTPGTVRAAALLMAVSSGIHAGLVIGHGEAQPASSALFLADSVALGAVAFAAFFAPVWWRRVSAGLLALTITAYLVYLVGAQEGPDQVGIASKLVEVCALGLLLVPSAGEGRGRHQRLRWAAVAAGVPVLTLVTGITVWGVDLAHPDAQHRHPGAVLQQANPVPTTEQQAAATKLREETRLAVARYQDWRQAAASGYRTVGPPEERVQHWTNDAYGGDSDVLNPKRPPGLVYVKNRHGLVLAGAMYQMPKLGEFGPDPGGPLTAWHIHDHICFTPVGFGIGFETPFATCPVTAISVTTHAMLHVWTVDNPRGGPFAVDLDPEVVDQLARS